MQENTKINMQKNKTVVVGMSGGVDSSVVALLLKQQGYGVVGLHMKNADDEQEKEDEKFVKDLAKTLGIKLEIIEYDDEMQKVKDYFVSEYLAGRTPNPCVLCNREVKFKPFIDFADKIGADYFATGHYANVEEKDGQFYLKKAEDINKDQTYFLNQLSQKQLSKVIFPLGKFSKVEVKKIAEENHLISANRKESYDVCFLGSQKFKDFIKDFELEKQGDIVDIDTKKVIGKHNGLSRYTLGQRKGLGIGGGFGKSGEAWFVVQKDLKTNTLFVAEGDDKALYSNALISKHFNWIPSVPEKKVFECKAKFRYRQPDQNVKVTVNDDGSVYIEFEKPQRAVTTGQFVVLYQADKNSNYDNCLGGGQIDEVYKERKF